MNITTINLILSAIYFSVAIYFAVSDYRHQFTKRTAVAMEKLYDSNRKVVAKSSLKSLLYSTILFAVTIIFIVKILQSDSIGAALNDLSVTWGLILATLVTLADKSESKFLLKEAKKKNN